jgi:hypothetical protein
MIECLVIGGLLSYIIMREYVLARRVSLLMVDKGKMCISLYNAKGVPYKIMPVALGVNQGDKRSIGDLRTPEGVFPVVSIEKSSTWTYDFENDGKGSVEGAYGPWFIRLGVSGIKGIGIHGTHDNTTIGKRSSHGCIRMRNDDLEYLKKWVSLGVTVIITNDPISLDKVDSSKVKSVGDDKVYKTGSDNVGISEKPGFKIPSKKINFKRVDKSTSSVQ